MIKGALYRHYERKRDIYQVVTEMEDYSARVSGKFQYGAVKPSDYPAVGDFVLIATSCSPKRKKEIIMQDESIKRDIRSGIPFVL